jgi:quaternary ammonium compound-resistance protein SugE
LRQLLQLRRSEEPEEKSFHRWCRRLSHPCRANIGRSEAAKRNRVDRDVGIFAVQRRTDQSKLLHHTDAEVAMNAWLALLAAGLLEIVWAFGLKYSDGLTRFWPTLATALAILASFSLMALALRSLPFGTAYAVWTGIGAAGSIILGMVIFSEPTDPVRIICLTLIVAGMVGLKLNSPV